eukprot:gene377-443_t
MISRLLVIVALAAVVSSQLAADIRYNLQDEPGSIPFHVQVLLIGFQGEGAFEYMLDARQLDALLNGAYKVHRPHSLQTSVYHRSPNDEDTRPLHDPRPLMSHYDITYTVKTLSSDTLYRLEHIMTTNKSPALNPVDGETYNIDIEPMEPFFEHEARQLGTEGSPVYTVIFVNPDRSRIGVSSYQYTFGGHVCGPAWIGAGRFVVVDLSAGPLKYGSTLHKSTEERVSEGSVDHDSLPRLVEYFLRDGYAGTSLQGASPIEIQAHLASLVISSIQHVFISDTTYNFIPLFQKILIPVLVFRDHNNFDPLEKGFNTSVDVDIIQKEARRIFPFSEVTVVAGSHSIHEHKHISMALSKSIKSHSSFELNPSTIQELLLKLKSEDDILASGLIGEQVTQIPKGLSKKDAQRTKILPIYIFSLANTEPNILLDKYHLYVALRNNYLWSYGEHPFGFFGTATQISQIFTDTIIRNTIITSIQASADELSTALDRISDFSRKYLIDALGYDIDEMPSAGYLIDRLYHSAPNHLPLVKTTVKRLHDELESIQEKSLLMYVVIGSLFTVASLYTLTHGYTSARCLIQLLLTVARLLLSAMFVGGHLIFQVNEQVSLHHVYMVVSYLSFVLMFSAIYNVTGLSFVPVTGSRHTPTQPSIRELLFLGRRVVIAELLSLLWIHSILLLVSPIPKSSTWLDNLAATPGATPTTSKKRAVYAMLSVLAIGYLCLNVRLRTGNLSKMSSRSAHPTNSVAPKHQYDNWSIELLTKTIDRMTLISTIIYALFTIAVFLIATNPTLLPDYTLYLIEATSIIHFTYQQLKLITQIGTHSRYKDQQTNIGKT